MGTQAMSKNRRKKFPNWSNSKSMLPSHFHRFLENVATHLVQLLNLDGIEDWIHTLAQESIVASNKPERTTSPPLSPILYDPEYLLSYQEYDAAVGWVLPVLDNLQFFSSWHSS
jgi:hypothetical protein